MISRTVDHQPLLEPFEARLAVLNAIDYATRRTDWRLLAYALMQTHLHLALLVGHDPPERLLRPMLTTSAMRLNDLHGRTGPVFMQRAKTIYASREHASRLIAYIHNNPVRAGVVSSAIDSGWTSHRAIVGARCEVASRALFRGATLRLCGMRDDQEGRRAFDAMVVARQGATRDAILSGESLAEQRRIVRDATAIPVELSSSVIDGAPGESQAWIEFNGEARVLPRWGGPLDTVLDRVCAHESVLRDVLLSRSRTRRITRARRLFLVVGAQLLRRRQLELATFLGIAESSASMLLRAPQLVIDDARRIASELRETGADDALGGSTDELGAM